MNVWHQGNSPISILGNKIQHTSGRHLGKVSCILIVYQYTTTHIHTRTSSVCRQNKLSLVQLQHSYWIYVTLSFSAAALTNHQKKITVLLTNACLHDKIMNMKNLNIWIFHYIRQCSLLFVVKMSWYHLPPKTMIHSKICMPVCFHDV